MLHRRRFLFSGTSLVLAATRRVNAAESFPRSDEEWRALLTPEQYAVLRLGVTEQPYSSPLDGEKRHGIFACAGCRLPLFSSRTKYDSRTGWPSFWRPLDNAVLIKTDRSQGLYRTQADCRRCGSHIGHVFGDGPPPTHLRYCVNGAVLIFTAA